MSKKTVFLRTFGCQMNSRDSEFVTGLLIDNGYTLAPSIDKADVVIFNSCAVRKHAEDKLFSHIADLKPLKAKKKGLIIVLMGCVAQNYKDEAVKRLPIIDIVCGPGDEAKLPRIIADVARHREHIIAIEDVDKKRPEITPEYRSGELKALVSIGEGCNNFCTYCIVPYARGRERYRDPKDIVREVRGLARRGFKEILLLGQNVNSYGRGTGSDGQLAVNFAGLLEEINEIDGIKRIRFMTSHPKDASEELFKAMCDLDKVCEHLHLPLQSGSDRILKAMNRGYDRNKYMKDIELYKRYLPLGAITTDVIVGFPGETEKDFKETLRVMKDVGFDNAFTFKYSPRPPAASSELEDDVTMEVKDRRLQELMKLQARISIMKNERFKGKIVDVLVESIGTKADDTVIGRTRTNKMVVFGGGAKLIGSLVNVEIEDAKSNILAGRMVG